MTAADPMDVLRALKAKTVTCANRANFPMLILFEGEQYEIRYTARGGLILRRYENTDEVLTEAEELT